MGQMRRFSAQSPHMQGSLLWGCTLLDLNILWAFDLLKYYLEKEAFQKESVTFKVSKKRPCLSHKNNIIEGKKYRQVSSSISCIQWKPIKDFSWLPCSPRYQQIFRWDSAARTKLLCEVPCMGTVQGFIFRSESVTHTTFSFDMQTFSQAAIWEVLGDKKKDEVTCGFYHTQNP